MREVTGGAMLAYRKLERAAMQRRLEAAAAAIAGGMAGGRGPSISASAQVRRASAAAIGAQLHLALVVIACAGRQAVCLVCALSVRRPFKLHQTASLWRLFMARLSPPGAAG